MPRREVSSIRIDSLNAVIRDLIAMGLRVEDLKDSFQDIGRQGVGLAAMYAPRRTGRLAGDIRANRLRNKSVISVGRANRVPYAGPINYGWAARNISASGFMQKADKALQPFALRRIEQEINAQIRRRGLG